ncbi:MAG: aldehyde dehydrogenase family protein, partial [Candidatus Limnocylindrales bacterium]
MASLFIDGAWSSGARGATNPVINPFDQSVIAEVDIADDVDVDRAILAARRAFDDGPWPATSPTERGVLLNHVADLLQRDREEIARTETLNTGKAIREGRFDVDDVTSVFRYYAGLADKDAGRVVATGSAASVSRIVYEPVGVCGLISPWNYPLLQASWKIAPALAAGNTFVLKPAQVTPLTAIHLFRLLAEAGLPAGVGNLLLGPGERVGAALAERRDVDLVSFTGGGVAGRSIMRAAAGNVKKVALELGGKSPNIVFADADFETAVDYALTAAFLHSGQVCSAGCRAIVEDSIYDRFVAEVARRTELIRLGDGFDERTETGPLISAEHLAKVEGYVRIGREEGARLVAGGSRPLEPELAQGFFFRPTVFADCRHDMRIVQEEIFGPVLTIERFTSEDEAIAIGNDTVYGLAGAVWTGDPGRGQRVAGRLRHGTIWIN